MVTYEVTVKGEDIDELFTAKLKRYDELAYIEAPSSDEATSMLIGDARVSES